MGGLYDSGLSPETAARLVVVWDATLADLLSEYGAITDDFRFDFERAFYDGHSPWQAIQEALGLSAYGPASAGPHRWRHERRPPNRSGRRPMQLLASIEAAVAAAWPHPVWLTGEIDQVNTSGRHVHLTLIDENSRLRVAAIGLDAQRVKGRLARAGLVLERGASIRVYGKVHIYPLRGDIELRAIDIDPAMGVGDAEAQRRRTLEVIAKLGLAERQRGMPTPVAPLRVGVVTPGGQGWEDFEARMRMTPWAWDLRVLLTPSEGPRAAESVESGHPRPQRPGRRHGGHPGRRIGRHRGL